MFVEAKLLQLLGLPPARQGAQRQFLYKQDLGVNELTTLGGWGGFPFLA